MQQHIGHVRCACAAAKKLGVQHEREPGERVPVAGVSSRKRPFDVYPRKTAGHVRIAKEIFVIVKIHEAVVPDRGINSKRCEHQQETNNDRMEKRAELAGV
ncbi:MAG TPA: hypothetical protein VMO20_06670 [Candidatus Acidoferrum sp.]|nr:hypothetical protein [Candidatus Acidoferrum sp.]